MKTHDNFLYKTVRLTAVCMLITVFGASAIHAQERIPAEKLNATADSAYKAEDYGEARDLYLQSINTYGPSAKIYYNLGNAYYRAGDIGHAVLSYERSLRLDPTDKDTRQNLRFATPKNLPEDDSSFLFNVHKSILNGLTPNGWAWSAFGLFVVFLGAVALYIFSPKIMWRKVGFFSALVLLFITLYAVFVAIESRKQAVTHLDAIVTAPSSTLNTVPRTPKDKSDKILSLPEGAKVSIIDSILTPEDPECGKWYEVKLNNTTRAWIPEPDVEKI